MRFHLPFTGRHYAAMSLVVVLLAMIGWASGLFAWSPLACRHEDMDINSGRVRHTRYLFYICINESVEDTFISGSVAPVGPPDWRRVNTFSPGVHYSPHYRYHGAIAQAKALELMDQLVPFTPKAKERAAVAVLRGWHQGSYGMAERFIHRLGKLVADMHDKDVDALDVHHIEALTEKTERE